MAARAAACPAVVSAVPSVSNTLDERGLRILESGPSDRAPAAHLAGHGMDRLSYRDLRLLADDPVGDLDSGRREILARAELSRLGLSR